MCLSSPPCRRTTQGDRALGAGGSAVSTWSSPPVPRITHARIGPGGSGGGSRGSAAISRPAGKGRGVFVRMAVSLLFRRMTNRNSSADRAAPSAHRAYPRPRPPGTTREARARLTGRAQTRPHTSLARNDSSLGIGPVESREERGRLIHSSKLSNFRTVSGGGIPRFRAERRRDCRCQSSRAASRAAAPG